MSLKQLIAKHGVLQTDLRQVLIQRNGRPLSSSAISQMLGHGVFPKLINRQEAITQLTKYLAGQGIPKAEIKAAWQSLATTHTAATTQSQEFDMSRKTILSQAARDLFKLSCNPFENDVQGRDDVFASPETTYIQETMYHAALNAEFMAIIGESGSGKTILKKDLINRCMKDDNILFIQPRCYDKSKVTEQVIGDAIILDVAPDTKLRVKQEYRARQIEQLLINSIKAGNANCLILEEAHKLSTETLSSLKQLLESEYKSRRLLSIILIGQPELKDKLNERNHYEIREVIRRCQVVELKPLGVNLKSYLAKKFARLGIALSSIFSEDAFDAIRAKLSDNIHADDDMTYPLIVNEFVLRCLNKAADIATDDEEMDVITAELVGEVK